MKSALPTIQLLFKIARVLAKIVFVFCIVAAAFCLVGLIAVAAGSDVLFKIGSITVRNLVNAAALPSSAAVYAALICGLVSTIPEAVLAKIALRCFERELSAGTPFTFEGANEMKRLAICTIAIPLAATIVCAIVCALFALWAPEVQRINFSADVSVAIGLMLLVLSLVCRYGAEVSNAN